MFKIGTTGEIEFLAKKHTYLKNKPKPYGDFTYYTMSNLYKQQKENRDNIHLLKQSIGVCILELTEENKNITTGQINCALVDLLKDNLQLGIKSGDICHLCGGIREHTDGCTNSLKTKL